MAAYRTPKASTPAVVESKTAKQYLRDTPVVVAGNRSAEYKATKTDGIQIRGCGAATKGKMARGPMA
jgi:hypothetical protein